MNNPKLGLKVYALSFTVQSLSLVHLGRQAGSQLRGAFWSALEPLACPNPQDRADPQHQRHCPMCRLVALETRESARGLNPPRPFAIRPPLPEEVGEDVYLPPDTEWSFAIHLFGDTSDLLPYVAQAVYKMGEIGVGYGRGRFVIRRISAQKWDSREGRVLYAGSGFTLPLQASDALQHDHVVTQVNNGLHDTALLRFITPIQLTHEGRTLSKPEFPVLMGRLLERCQAMEQDYTAKPEDVDIWRDRYQTLTQLAYKITLQESHTHWLMVQSGSRRTNRLSAISGFVGDVRLKGDLQPFLYWLAWGSAIHVGKNAVKGNGWYQLEE